MGFFVVTALSQHRLSYVLKIENIVTLMISTALFYYIIYSGSQISRQEGFTLLLAIILILLYLFLYQKKRSDELLEDFNKNDISIYKSFLFILFSGSLLWLGS